MQPVCLANRKLIQLFGNDALPFLQDLLTCNVEPLRDGKLVYGALLTPQGKIVAEMILHPHEDRLLIETDEACLQSLLQKLSLYKLRRDVTIEARPDRSVCQSFEPFHADEKPDPRHAELGYRCILPEDRFMTKDSRAYQEKRIGLGISEGTPDLIYGNSYPQDIGMDALGGIDFQKGCYIGQEVISRMKHRGTAKTRPFQVNGLDELTEGADIVAGPVKLGRLGSVAGKNGIAILRQDRLDDARQKKLVATIDDRDIKIQSPSWGQW